MKTFNFFFAMKYTIRSFELLSTVALPFPRSCIIHHININMLVLQTEQSFWFI